MINSEWVLCAESCRNLDVDGGSSTAIGGIEKDMSIQTAQKRLVIMWITHPEYEESSVNLALLKLEYAFVLNEYLSPVSILTIDRKMKSDGTSELVHPLKKQVKRGKRVDVISDELTVLPQKICESTLNQTIYKHEFCSRFDRNDSRLNWNGPLMTRRRQLGVFSRNISHRNEMYLIFTRIDSQVDYLMTMCKQVGRSSSHHSHSNYFILIFFTSNVCVFMYK